MILSQQNPAQASSGPAARGTPGVARNAPGRAYLFRGAGLKAKKFGEPQKKVAELDVWDGSSCHEISWFLVIFDQF